MPSVKAMMGARPTRAAAAGMLAAVLLAGCTGYRGEWPRLAPADASDLAFQESPDTAVAAAQGNDAAAQDNAAAPAQAAPAPPLAGAGTGDLVALKARMQEVAARFAALTARYERQRARLQDAFKQVRPGRLEAWKDAQFELSRLNQIVLEIREERRDAGRVAADLSGLAAAETDVGEALHEAGNLIHRMDAAIVDADSFTATVSQSLERHRRGLV
ncbi:MAG: hypothetical protein D6782_12355 [Alphaproteobacteria bacterium]|nr:MAG: hypothetical protein D6782_12355 [Alphaproteobacteria bacterium]